MFHRGPKARGLPMPSRCARFLKGQRPGPGPFLAAGRHSMRSSTQDLPRISGRGKGGISFNFEKSEKGPGEKKEVSQPSEAENSKLQEVGNMDIG